MLRRIITALSLCLVFCMSVQGQDRSIAWKRVQHLQRGVSLSDWLTNSDQLSIQQLRSYTAPEDIEHIHQLGFDHIRIPVGPDLFRCTGSWDSCDDVQILDQVVHKALSLDLAVIIDFHPDAAYTQQLDRNDQAVVEFQRLWAKIADRYGSIDSDRIVFEVMNEFNINDPYRWSGILSSTVQVIRRHAPSSTIIVSGATYSDIWDLINLPDLTDPNLIYNFHYYEPHIFTHQGAWWSSVYWKDIRNLPFPATQSAMDTIMDNEENETVRWQLHQYVAEHWDAARIASDIDFAAAWGKKHNVPLMCDEFGVYRKFSAPEDRERWISAVRTALEKDHIGWTAWDYQGGFGVVYKENGAIRDDDAELRGLGLKK